MLIPGGVGMFFSVLMAAAAAGGSGPVTCEAVFIGPAAECSLEGQWAATGTASGESKAKKRASARLTEATELALQARSLQSAGTLAAVIAEQQRVICPTEVAQHARISCFASPELIGTQTCFADLPVEDCPDVPVVILEGVGFKAMEKSRKQLCQDVDDALETSEFSAAEQLSCRSRCLVESRVRCR
ncbi:MAG: hypothetical protein ACI8RZ_005740 [Myxococcota bacterium]|jgi:hypothetical protein